MTEPRYLNKMCRPSIAVEISSLSRELFYAAPVDENLI